MNYYYHNNRKIHRENYIVLWKRTKKLKLIIIMGSNIPGMIGPFRALIILFYFKHKYRHMAYKIFKLITTPFSETSV